MKDKMIETKNGDSLYVMDELTYNNRIFIFSVECDPVTETVKQDEFIVMECKMDGKEIGLFDVDDEETGAVVTNMFIERLQKQN